MKFGRSRAHWLAIASAALALALPTPAFAQRQAAPNERRSDTYYAAHSATIVTFLGGTALLYFSLPFGAPRKDPEWFPGDVGLRGQRSVRSADVSDSLLTLTLVNPLVLQLGGGADRHLLNATFVYGEVLAANLFFNFATKVTVRRPRPYTYSSPAKGDQAHGDRNVSFYSGHSSMAFTSAIAGSLLFAESAPDNASRLFVWSMELALAGATANLRTRAGKHYYSDVLVGGLVGSGVGILVPVLHGARRAPQPSEYLAAGGGLLGGILLSALWPLKQDTPPQKASIDWQLGPWAAPGSIGVSANGSY